MTGPRGAYGLLGLVAVFVAVVAFLPYLRSAFAPLFPEGFRDLDCKGVTCKEGEFCQENVCHPVAPSITNDYFKMM
jgi:hypothetical protein